MAELPAALCRWVAYVENFYRALLPLCTSLLFIYKKENLVAGCVAWLKGQSCCGIMYVFYIELRLKLHLVVQLFL